MLEQVLRKPTEKGALLHLLLVHRVEIQSHRGQSNHRAIKFKVFDRRKSASKSSALDINTTDFRLLRELVIKTSLEKYFCRRWGPSVWVTF